jgi:hypothetical protein
VSFALTIVDAAKRALYYNEEFRDMIVKALAMKCRWQIQRFKRHAAETVICFVDEPILSAFGSSTYVSVTRDDVVGALGEVVEAIHRDGGVAGVHCCGNTDWSIPLDAGTDVLNFDAFAYGETLGMYSEHVARHLEAGGVIAWGIVPTSPVIREQAVPALADRLGSLVRDISKTTGVDEESIWSQTMLTGSCGTGTLDIADAERVFALTSELSEFLRERHSLASPAFTGEKSERPIAR